MRELLDEALYYLKATWRYRWFAVLVAWLIALGGWFFVDRLPNQYVSGARFYIDTQSMLRPLLSGLAVQPNDFQIVRMVSRVLTSRENLEKVVQLAGLGGDPENPGEREQLLARLATNITVSGSGKENIYNIAYQAPSPGEAKRIVEALLALFVQESVDDKRKDTETARAFIDQQLQSYGVKLKAAEKAVMEFKREHVGLMPGEGQGYYAQLRAAEEALRQSRLDLREAENSRNAIKQQIDRYVQMNPSRDDSAVGQGVNPALDARITALEKKLDDLRVTYTDQHPDVVALDRLVAHLRVQRADEAKLAKPDPHGQRVVDVGYQQLLVALSSAEANVAALRARVAGHDRRYNELKGLADALPRVEAEFTQLTRDYQVIRSRYNQLLERRESAQISGEVESTASTAFRVVDPPRLPGRPSAPNRLRLVTIVLLAALAGGFGVAFLFGQFRPTFDNERKLREFSGLPVLGTVLDQLTETQKTLRRRGFAAFVISVGGLLSVYMAIIASLSFVASGA